MIKQREKINIYIPIIKKWVMRKALALCHVLVILSLGPLFYPGQVLAADEAKIAETLAKTLKAGRAVVSDHQDMINDAGKGDKGFTADYFEKKWLEKYKEMTKGDIPELDVIAVLINGGKEAIVEAQPLINKQGIGFKGFIPALWGRKAAEKFTQKTGIKLKQTTLHYRFAGNKPDEFETEALKQFTDPNYPRGKEIVKTVTAGGAQVLRYMAPEYYAKSCLVCHGDPKGEKDITGMKKEGFKEGDLSGAISVIVPLK